MKRESDDAGGAKRKGEDGGSPPAGGGSSRRRDLRIAGTYGYTRPWAIIARATLMNPAMLAPTTKFPGEPNSSAASEQSW